MGVFLFGAIFWQDVLGWSILALQRRGMVDSEECLLDVAWHGEVDMSFVVVPVERDSYVPCAHLVFRDSVVLLKNVHYMSSVGCAFVLDAKVVHDESEIDWSLVMCPEAKHQIA